MLIPPAVMMLVVCLIESKREQIITSAAEYRDAM